METLRFDTSVHGGQFKLLNATNGGPWHKRHANDQYRSNFRITRGREYRFSETTTVR